MTTQDNDEEKKETKETSSPSGHKARERMGGESQTPSGSHETVEDGSFSAYLQAHGFSPRRVIYTLAALAGIVITITVFVSLFGVPQKGVPVMGPPSVPQRVKPTDPGGLKVDPSLSPASRDSSPSHIQDPEQPNLEGLDAHYGLSSPKSGSTEIPEGEAAQQAGSVKHQERAVHLGRRTEEDTREASEDSEKPQIMVQLSAERNDEDAKRNWQRVQKNYARLVAQKTPHIERGQLNGATIYRLRLSGFATRKDALHFCHTAKMQHLPCILVR